MDNIKGFSGYSVIISPPSKADISKINNSYSHGSPPPVQKALNEDLNLFFFKTQHCQKKAPHDPKQCHFYHSPADRRRIYQPYLSDLCEIVQKYVKHQNYEFVCPNGDFCQKCHNKVEQMYSLQKYKTRFCTNYPKNVNCCQYGIYCPLAHKEDQLRMELIHHYIQDADFFIFHYKTLWCPFYYIKHDKNKCVYAHNWQDYRRKPNVYQYDATPCPNWNPNNFIMNYEQQCKNQSLCGKCHGWKQIEYHPLNYKTRQCSNSEKCPKGTLCPYFHHKKERRVFSEQVRSGFFVHYPRNRRTVHEVITIQQIKNNSCKESTKVNSFQDSISDSSYEENCDQTVNEKDEEIEAMVKKLVDQ